MRFFYKILLKNKEYKYKNNTYYIDCKWRKENVFAGMYSYDANIVKFILKEKINNKFKKLYSIKFEYKLTDKNIDFNYCIDELIKSYYEHLEYNKKIKDKFRFI